MLIVIALIVGHQLSPNFLDPHYLLDTTSLYAEAGFLTLGMTLVIVSGQIDLSVASTMALTAGVAAMMMEHGVPVPVAAGFALLLGAALGAINGLLIAGLGLPSFVVTLATMASYRGIAHILLGAGSVKLPASFVGADMIYLPGTPIPLPLSMLVVAGILVALVARQSVIGQWIYAVGTNARASFFSGVPNPRVTLFVFSFSGMCAGIAALLIDSRLGVARYDLAQGLELDVITAVVLGGASIYGGKGTILGSLLALVLIGLVRTELGLANITAEYQLAALGTLLIVAVLLGNLLDRTGQKSGRQNRAKVAS